MVRFLGDRKGTCTDHVDPVDIESVSLDNHVAEAEEAVALSCRALFHNHDDIVEVFCGVTQDLEPEKAVWAARRVPRDHVAVVANQFVITTLPPEERYQISWFRECGCTSSEREVVALSLPVGEQARASLLRRASAKAALAIAMLVVHHSVSAIVNLHILLETFDDSF